ncbi:MAG TPA: hypothetical protein DDW34_12910 [Clostridium sp.]|nr:hypothetical protein [Clostridium sp.]
MDNLLTPENDQQELWELNGRVKAFIAYAELRIVVSKDEIIAMLTGELPSEQEFPQIESEVFEPWNEGEESK